MRCLRRLGGKFPLFKSPLGILTISTPDDTKNSSGARASVITRLQQVGTRSFLHFGLLTIFIWGLVSAFAVYQTVQERSNIFRYLVETNQEAIVSGQWRTFTEGLRRNGTAGLTDIEICWGPTPDVQCPKRIRGSWFSLPMELPLMNGDTPLVWVRSRISILPALRLSGVIFLALLVTGLAAVSVIGRLRRDSELASIELARIVSKAASQGDVAALDELPSEIRPLGEALARSLREVQESKEKALLADLAAQVAHDIRSPLSVLDATMDEVEQLPERKRIMIRGAINQIRDITNNLLAIDRAHRASEGGKSTRSTSPDVEPIGVHLLSSLIEPIITEKRLQFRTRIGLEIDARLDGASYGLFAFIGPVQFKRVLSNLINNAVEALGERGSVRVHLSKTGNEILLAIQDNGKGIRPEILAKLGQRGETHGKAGGSGLGLYHARTTAESWGGGLTIQSEHGRGTTVTLRLPAVNPPAWFVSVLAFSPGCPVVVLDDDRGIHQIWKARFDALQVGKNRIEVVHFSTAGELRAWVREYPEKAGTAMYLTDYELLGHKETGLAVVKDLGVCDRAILITSRFEEQGILDQCLRLKVRMLPKALAGFVPMSILTVDIDGISQDATPLKRLDAVLIEDDELVRMAWEDAALKQGKEFLALRSADDFFRDAAAIDRRTPVYVDVKLADGVRGDALSGRIRDFGFTDVYLATGHDPSAFAGLGHLRGVVGKDPPWT